MASRRFYGNRAWRLGPAPARNPGLRKERERPGHPPRENVPRPRL